MLPSTCRIIICVNYKEQQEHNAQELPGAHVNVHDVTTKGTAAGVLGAVTLHYHVRYGCVTLVTMVT